MARAVGVYMYHRMKVLPKKIFVCIIIFKLCGLLPRDGFVLACIPQGLLLLYVVIKNSTRRVISLQQTASRCKPPYTRHNSSKGI